MTAIRDSLELPYFRYMPTEAVAAACASFEYGAEKYSPINWQKGLPWQQIIDSLRRHLDDFEKGVDIDESGLPHICMIMSNAAMLATSYIRNIGEDNRIDSTDPELLRLSSKECAEWMKECLSHSKIKKDK